MIAHELLTSRRLFVGESDAATIRNVRGQTIQPPSRYARGISQDLDDIVMTALQRDPDQRFQNAGAMRVALTAEVRRLRMAVSPGLIRDWVEWAFTQKPRSDATLRDLFDTLEPSITVEPTEKLRMTPASTPRSRPISVPPPVAPKKARASRWNPPTRWIAQPKPRSAAPFVLLAVIAFAALAIASGWIDLEAWRRLLAS